MRKNNLHPHKLIGIFIAPLFFFMVLSSCKLTKQLAATQSQDATITPKAIEYTPIPGCDDSTLTAEELMNCGTNKYHLQGYSLGTYWNFSNPNGDGSDVKDVDFEREFTFTFIKGQMYINGNPIAKKIDINTYLREETSGNKVTYKFSNIGYSWVAQGTTNIDGCSDDPEKMCQYETATLIN